MNRKRLGIVMGMIAALALFLSVSVATSNEAFADPGGVGRPGCTVTVFVTSQGLFYDSIITGAILPANGPFQDLVPVKVDGETQLQTEFGPGDPGYVGGRWRMDTPDGPVYFSCPLLGPGRDTQ